MLTSGNLQSTGSFESQLLNALLPPNLLPFYIKERFKKPFVPAIQSCVTIFELKLKNSSLLGHMFCNENWKYQTGDGNTSTRFQHSTPRPSTMLLTTEQFSHSTVTVNTKTTLCLHLSDYQCANPSC